MFSDNTANSASGVQWGPKRSKYFPRWNLPVGACREHFERGCCFGRGTRSGVQYFVLRLAIFVLYALLYLNNVLHNPRPLSKFYIYLTNWGTTLILVREGLAAYMAFEGIRDKRDGAVCSNLGYLHQFSFIISNVAASTSFVVSVFYWIILWNPATKKLNFSNCFDHILNSFSTVMDIMLSAKVFCFSSYIHSIAIGIAFGVFSFIFFILGCDDGHGNLYIYEPLNWEHPGVALETVAGTTLLWVLSHLLTVGLYKLRLKLFLPDLQPNDE